MTEPLETINQYTEILIHKLEKRPDIVKLIDAIKCLNRLVKFSVMDLQDISNIQ